MAIATALMPPLCTAGFGLASGNLGYFLGALYLFFINCLFIMLATYISVKYFRFRQTEYDDQATGRRTKRISSILIILFIVPSIWSAVTLIRQNNFEENAIAFVEQSKTYSRSIIYDYRIDHTEGSVIELFFTGDPLDEKTKETIRKTAEEYGIKESQLIINDHTYSNDTNDIELVKGIYDKMDEEIAKRDEEIRRLKEELRTSKGVDIPYSQIVREMKNNYPSIEEVHITHGAGVTADSLQVNESMIVLVTSSARLSEEDSTRLNDWLKIRLDSDSAKLILTN